MTKRINETEIWDRVAQHYLGDLAGTTLRDLFASDPDRGTKMALEHDGVYLDYSKNRIASDTLPMMHSLLGEVDLKSAINAMFSGEAINTSENRAVLHVALRNPSDSHITVDGHDVASDVKNTLQKMTDCAEKIRNGSWLGYSGKPIRNVVHIGIGGAEIGPHMACDVLADYEHVDINTYFISNIDPASFRATTDGIKPEETLFVVSSKTFTTTETLTNAESAKQWLLHDAGDDSAVAKHFVAVSTNSEAVEEFGIDTNNMFEMRDWIGGRFSLMSAAGLIVMISIGPENFHKLLSGAHSIDEHFRTAPFEQNIPVTLALISLMYNNFFGAETELIVPYSARLDRLTTYLQQANMESNGKSVRSDGEDASIVTGPIVWGRPGTDAQHTFMQHVHQGNRFIPTDFLVFKEPFEDLNGQHAMLLANAVAQAEALAFGEAADQLRVAGVDEDLIPHKVMHGNQPSNTLVFSKLTPYTLGQIIAIYEHKIFVQGVLWGINSFDQWGVQLGKVSASKIVEELRSGKLNNHDSSTTTLINKLQ